MNAKTKKYLQTIFEIVIFFALGILFIWTASLVTGHQRVIQTESDRLILDIHDREDGICSDMYAEGFEWGIGQIPLQVSIWRMEGKSEARIKELLYDMVNNWEYKN